MSASRADRRVQLGNGHLGPALPAGDALQVALRGDVAVEPELPSPPQRARAFGQS
jgi:hypothetical protein